MKHKFANARILIFARSAILFFLLFTSYSHAQLVTDSRINMVWDSQVGCQINEIDPDNIKDIRELIENGICPRVCENSTVTYSLNGESQYWESSTWSVSGGQIISSNLTTCVVKWGSSVPMGNVSVEINSPELGTQFREICVEIIKGPTANFGIFPDFETTANVCLLEEVFFTNLSLSSGGSEIISYYWDFGDGTYSSAFEPSHTFDREGEYNVSLKVTNSCNCSNTYSMTIIVGSNGFEIVCPGVVCEGATQSYSVPADSSVCNKFSWSVEGGSFVGNTDGPGVQVLWDNVGPDGFGYLTFDSNQCSISCAGKKTIKIPVIASTGTIQGETMPCENKQYLYKLPQWPDTDFTWSIQGNNLGANLVRTDQRNEILLNTGGNGTIVLRATYKNKLLGCDGSAFLTINVKKNPEIIGNTQLCVGTSASYTLGDDSTAWILEGPNGQEFGFGNEFNFTFSAPGAYSLSGSSANFCNARKLAITVYKNEEAPQQSQFSGPEEICVNSPYSFSLTPMPGFETYWSTSSNGQLIGSTVGDEITVIFSNSNVPPVLTAYRRSNTFPFCSSEATSITLEFPQIDKEIEGLDSVCPSSSNTYQIKYYKGESYSWSVTPSNLGSIAGNGSSTNIYWNATSVSQNATVKVKIRKCNLYFEKEFQVTIKGTPASQIIGANTVCAEDDLSLQVQLPASTVWESITWDFGDNTSVTVPYPQKTVTHAYTVPPGGNVSMAVSAKINGADGCAPFKTLHHVVVSPLPVANITPSGNREFCTSDTISLDLTATIQAINGINNPNAISWYHNGMFIQHGFSLTATSVGDYYAVITNSNNCTSETNHVFINRIECSNPSICDLERTLTLNTSLSGCAKASATAVTSSTPISYNWITNGTADINLSTANSFEATYDKAGIYTITYEATYSDCTIFAQKNVLIPYVSSLKYILSCGSEPNTYKVKLIDDSSFMPQTPVTNRIFKVGNTVVYTGSNSEFEVSLAPGDYTISVTVSGANPSGGVFPSCTSTAAISMPNLLNANFTFENNRCLGESITFVPENISQGLTYHWDFGDNTENRLASPRKVFDTHGTKVVTLTVTNRYGCSVSYSQNVSVKENKLNGRILTPPRACKGSTINLQYVNQGLSTPSRYYWMKDTVIIGETSVPNYGVTGNGSYWVIVEDEFGCQKIDIPSVPAVFMPLPSATITGPSIACVDDGIIQLKVADTPSAFYEWRLDGNIIGTQSSIYYTVSTSGIYNFTVTVGRTQTKMTCYSTSQHTVTVLNKPEPPTVSYDFKGCSPYEFHVSANTYEEGTYTWSNGAVGSGIDVNEGGVYNVIFTNRAGCSSQTEIHVPKNSERYLWVFPSGCYDICDTENPSLLGPLETAEFHDWSWLYNGSVLESGIESVSTISVDEPGKYALQLNNGYCDVVSKEASISRMKCNCDIKASVGKATSSFNNFCHYNVEIFIDNTHSEPISVTLSVPSGLGTFQPSYFIVPPGYHQFNPIFIPADNYTGNSALTIAFTTTLPNGEKCRITDEAKFPKLCPELSESVKQKNIQIDSVTFLVVPNPATSNTDLHYHFTGDSKATKTISIYTLIGILVDEYHPKSDNGVWNVNLDKYPSGQYIAIMRENGSLVAQKNLIKK